MKKLQPETEREPSLRMMLLRDYHLIVHRRASGWSWSRLSPLYGNRKATHLWRAWNQLENAIQKGRVSPAPLVLPIDDDERSEVLSPNNRPVVLTPQPVVTQPPAVIPKLISTGRRIENPLPIQAPMRMTPEEYDRQIEAEAEAELAAARAEFKSKNPNK